MNLNKENKSKNSYSSMTPHYLSGGLPPYYGGALPNVKDAKVVLDAQCL